jgi:hypothetical protein
MPEIECAHCGNKSLMQVPGAWTPLPLGIEGKAPGPVVPVVLMGCPACGYIQMFTAQAIAPEPFPEEPPGPVP